QCMTWKSEQHDRTKTRDILRLAWVAPLLIDILSSKNREFGGVLSVLRAGGRVVAAHFGIRSGSVLHYWLPSYDIELGSYSPGMILLMEMLDAASGHGIDTVDLGRGSSLYKTRVATTAVPLIEGAVAPERWARTLRRSRSAITGWARKSPLRAPLRTILHKFRQ
ncbi:MAG TPA: GNAT family N-acetyltransferase, partial [Caulobacteraceae bacterium]|nr:GNAT family N-acetyltransferase [Caulobacteraceae bacterium]